MARMSIDDMFLRDPRVVRLARALGCHKFEAHGRLLAVYAVVYDQVDSGGDVVVSAANIDIAAEFEGFAERMVEFDLATNERRGVRIRGAKERTNYLSTRESSGRAGGIKSGESRRNNAKVETKVTFVKTEGRLNPSVPDSASAPDSLTYSEKNSAAPSAGGSQLEILKEKVIAATGDLGRRRARARKPHEATASEAASVRAVLDKLGQHNGVNYSGTAEHSRLIVAHLRDGATEMDLRAVVGYCALELAWKTDPDMAKYLRPETLFGPRTISKYLDPARAWADKLSDDRPQRAHAHESAGAA